jgi:prolyl oligopeptidase
MNGCYQPPVVYPPTPRMSVTDVVHGVTITDDFRWLEDGSAPAVTNWLAEQEALARRVLDALPQQHWLTQRLERLWRYDDETVPVPVLDGTRVFFSRKRANDEKSQYMTAAATGAPAVVLLDPNTWDTHETLDGATPSPDGAYVVYGVARAGDEDARLRVLRLADRTVLPDTFQGWRQGGVSWLRDCSGFFYAAKPLKDSVPAGEEHYWHAAWFHKLGATAAHDQKIFWDDTTKEYWHNVGVNEDGRWLILYRSLFNRTDVYIKPVGSTNAPVPVVTNMDARFSVSIVNDRIYIKTNWQAPRERVMVADVTQPGIAHWRTFIPERDDTLEDVQFVAGKVFAVYLHNACSLIRIHNIDGTFERELPLPGFGSAGVWGYWSKPTVWVSFTSYTQVPTTYAYDILQNTLTVLHRSKVPFDTAPYDSTQVWYHSKDGTAVPMFLLGTRGAKPDGSHAVLLTGYGGFNVSMQPGFSTIYGLWLEAGGMVAIPCLRGGGEFGEDWHRAGMRANKQNVFDDFIAAAG